MVQTKTNNLHRRLIFIFLSVTLIVTSATALYRLYQQRQNRAAYENAQSLFYEHHSLTHAAIHGIPSEFTLDDPSPKIINPAIEALQEINSDVIAWIQIAETQIDYPVVQGVDNRKYLDHNWQNEKNRAGSIFMDYRNDPHKLNEPGRHTILYGHHMRDGSMFQPLTNYLREDFFENHSIITLQGMYEIYVFEIFSVYVTDTDFYYIETIFENPSDFEFFLEQITDKSIYDTEQRLTRQDHLLTLSTCTYEYDDARLVVHARLIDTSKEEGS